MHRVGFTIEIHYDAWSNECQTVMVFRTKMVVIFLPFACHQAILLLPPWMLLQLAFPFLHKSPHRAIQFHDTSFPEHLMNACLVYSFHVCCRKFECKIFNCITSWAEQYVARVRHSATALCYAHSEAGHVVLCAASR